MVNSLEDELTAVHEQVAAEVLLSSYHDSPVLCHYTSLSGATSILQKNELRFSNATYLNDPNEINSGLEIFCKVALNKIEDLTTNGSDLFADLLGLLLFRICNSFTPKLSRRRIDSLYSFLLQKLSSPAARMIDTLRDEEWYAYIACFSEEPDNLRQWIPYAENGKGCSLSFVPMVDKYHYITERSDIYLTKVCYANVELKTQYVLELINRSGRVFYSFVQQHYSSQELGEIHKDPSRDPFLCYFTEMSKIIATDLIACKGEDYQDEKEWRLFFVTTMDQIKNQTLSIPGLYLKDGVLKPYYDIPILDSSIQGVKLGPLCSDLNANSFGILNHHREKPLEISKSQIKYRG